MNAELEALLKAFDAYLEATGEEAKRLRLLYESRVDEVLDRCPHLSRTSLEQSIRLRYRKWIATQKQPPTLPPNA